MILYQLPNGKAVKLTFQQWLDLDDDFINELMLRGAGEEFNDPWFDSPISGREQVRKPEDWEFLEEE